MATKEKAENYTSELQARIVELYDGGNGMTPAQIGAEINRSANSVRSKLVHLKVYVPVVKAPKTFVDTGPSKKNLIEVLKAQGFSQVALDGLNNATKPALQEVIDRLKVSDEDTQDEANETVAA